MNTGKPETDYWADTRKVYWHLKKKEHSEAFDTVGKIIHTDWINFALQLRQVEDRFPEMNGILDRALEYFTEKEEYETCKRICKCRDFLEFRRPENTD